MNPQTVTLFMDIIIRRINNEAKDDVYAFMRHLDYLIEEGYYDKPVSF